MRDLLARALSRDDDWLDRRYQDRDGEPGAKLYPLLRAEDQRCSVLVAVFEPGVPAPIHNHGSWAVVGVYSGRERETWFRRLDDGSTPGRADLEVDRSWVNTPGTVTVVPDGTIHTVEAVDSTRRGVGCRCRIRTPSVLLADAATCARGRLGARIGRDSD